MSNLASMVRRRAKSLLRPLIFRYPPIGLQPERLQVWLRSLIETLEVDGAVVEIGCHLGGTSAVSWQLLENLETNKRYVCIDTFEGFVPSQFDDDLSRGNFKSNRWLFADNSMSITRAVLDQHGARGVELIQGDISTVDDSLLPEHVAIALIDVDLAAPTYDGLKRLYSRLSEGGVIVVDDCPPHTSWKAKQGYEEFCKDVGIEPVYEMGMGLVRRPLRSPSNGNAT